MAGRSIASIEVRADWCKRCGICTALCPKKVFDEAPDGTVLVARPEDCIACEICERACPDFAITLHYREASA